MKNPWQDISLNDYENHMQLDAVQQLPELNKIMKKQFSQYPIETLMILGIAGGNGLEHISLNQIHKVYGVDINQDYLVQCQQRYTQLESILECICADLCSEDYQLPHVDLVVADLLIEYIGYTGFQKVLQMISPQFVSCVIQINPNDEFVSTSPYTHVFEHLDEVHHQLEEIQLIQHMKDIHYEYILKEVTLLPDSKQLLRLDFVKQSSLFDYIKNHSDVGIGADMLLSNNMKRTGQELIKDQRLIEQLQEYRSIACQNILTYQLYQYGWNEWLTCLNMNILLEYTIPMMSRMLAVNPLIPGLYYQGEILYRILTMSQTIRKEYPLWIVYFQNLYLQIMKSYSKKELIEKLGETMYNQYKALKI